MFQNPRVFLLFLPLIAQSAFAVCYSKEEGLDRACARNKAEDSKCKASGEATPYGFHDGSCIVSVSLEKKDRDVVREIEALEDFGVIPDEVLRKKSPALIARSLLYRYFQKVERPLITDELFEDPKFDAWGSIDLQMAFNPGIIHLILENGFLNNHQTGTSEGCSGCGTNRFQVENALPRIFLNPSYQGGLWDFGNFVRPKYCFPGFQCDIPGLEPEIISQYGRVFAVFKPSVKKRAFFTAGDSLSEGAPMYKRTQAPNGESAQRGEPSHVRSYYGLHAFDWKRPLSSSYFESQVYGSLTVERDVDYFIQGCPSIGASSDDFDVLKRELEHVGLRTPIYDCVETKRDGDVSRISKGIKRWPLE